MRARGGDEGERGRGGDPHALLGASAERGRGGEGERGRGGDPHALLGASAERGRGGDAGTGRIRPRVPASPCPRVLLVDDHALFLEGLRNLLVSEGMEVAGLAHDGLEALAQARRLRPDVILMDIQMPRCDGVAATRLIKAEMPECKIVMLTMSEDEQDLFEAVKSGASGYLLKRLDAADFFAYLAELQAGHPPFSPGLAEKILQEFAGQSTLRETDAETERRGDAETAEPSPDLSVPASPYPRVPLSPRQVQVLTLVTQGQTYRQVAETVGIAERTVKYHMAEILDRLHLENRAQVIAYATRMGWGEGERGRRGEGERG
jgi:DNA-binding NarL/FixJ family response regulator